jgi:uncharacterized glyoxalase superfamily protein PhnB
MSITPYLYYEDVEGALGFLDHAFGFSQFGELIHDKSGRLTHAAARHGDDVVMMGQPAMPYKGPKKLGQATIALYVTVPDLDAHCNRARDAGAVIIEPLKETPYGNRRYGAEDPEGHHWYFAN